MVCVRVSLKLYQNKAVRDWHSSEWIAYGGKIMTTKVLGAAAVVLLLCASAYGAFFVAPNELTMGVVQRIFYLHAPCGMTALASFMVCFVGNLGYLLKREPKWDWLAGSSAEVCLAFCPLVLLTGPIWPHPPLRLDSASARCLPPPPRLFL